MNKKQGDQKQKDLITLIEWAESAAEEDGEYRSITIECNGDIIGAHQIHLTSHSHNKKPWKKYGFSRADERGGAKLRKALRKAAEAISKE